MKKTLITKQNAFCWFLAIATAVEMALLISLYVHAVKLEMELDDWVGYAAKQNALKNTMLGKTNLISELDLSNLFTIDLNVNQRLKTNYMFNYNRFIRRSANTNSDEN